MSNLKITKLFARQILDSRGNPTIEVEAWSNSLSTRAIVPSGASTGKYEALELRDGGKSYGGKSVQKAVDNVNKIISKAIVGIEFYDQKSIDEALIKLDGTPNKSKLGANAILGVSMAACRLNAKILGFELHEYIARIFAHDEKNYVRNYSIPVPFANVINGGKHAGSNLKIQEFMVTPVYAKTFDDAVRMTAEIYHILKRLIEERYGKTAVNVGDEGGFAPNLNTPEQALDLLVDAIKKAGYAGKVKISIDAAASEFYNEKDGIYTMDKPYTKDQLVDYYYSLMKKYPIATLEDPFDQDDFESWNKLLAKAKKIGVKIIGDDLLVTNPERIKMAVEKKLCNGLLLKINQIGTITESINAANMAKSAGWIVMVSHRSGESEDTFISDLAVGLGCGHIKLGAPARTDRVAKYNQLLRISENQKIPYAKWSVFGKLLGKKMSKNKKQTKQKVDFEVGLHEHAHKETYVKQIKKDLESLAKDITIYSYQRGEKYYVSGDASQQSYEFAFCTKLSYEPKPSSNPRKRLSPEYLWKELTAAVVPKVVSDKVEYVRLQKMYSKDV